MHYIARGSNSWRPSEQPKEQRTRAFCTIPPICSHVHGRNDVLTRRVTRLTLSCPMADPAMVHETFTPTSPARMRARSFSSNAGSSSHVTISSPNQFLVLCVLATPRSIAYSDTRRYLYRFLGFLRLEPFRHRMGVLLPRFHRYATPCAGIPISRFLARLPREPDSGSSLAILAQRFFIWAAWTVGVGECHPGAYDTRQVLPCGRRS